MVSAITSIVGCIRNRASARLATKTKPQQPSGCAVFASSPSTYLCQPLLSTAIPSIVDN